MSTARHQNTDIRNLFVSISGLAVVIFVLAIFFEQFPGEVPSTVSATSQETAEQRPAVAQAAVVRNTTVNIQPLVVSFPPMPDFNAIDTVEGRKEAFIEYMTPIIEHQNFNILKDRRRLKKIMASISGGETPAGQDSDWLEQLAGKYGVDWLRDDPGSMAEELERRVDIIPVSLAIVQAAKESSWGRSRYAVEVNNVFGQWCFDEGCGVIPSERLPGALHKVKRFKSINDATRSYIHNLNTHERYEPLREIRWRLRLSNQPITGNALAEGLLFYSERRENYVEEVKNMIRQYRMFRDRRSV